VKLARDWLLELLLITVIFGLGFVLGLWL